ncbi:MAG: leucine-rich repeat protein [Lachnospiraceae bacterium]|nr:leucine-rich repeat protein [Lachnospiraceae bacterium]
MKSNICESLQRVSLPDTITAIKYQAFEVCSSLTEINIPENTKRLEKSCFGGCRALQNLYVPASVTEITGPLFYDCKKLVVTTSAGSAISKYYSNNLKEIRGLEEI